MMLQNVEACPLPYSPTYSCEADYAQSPPFPPPPPPPSSAPPSDPKAQETDGQTEQEGWTGGAGRVFIGKIRQLLIVGVKYLLGVRIASFPLKK